MKALASFRKGSQSGLKHPTAQLMGEKKLAVCQGLRHTASLCEVDRGGIEPPTPGFSVVRSSRACSLATHDDNCSCDLSNKHSQDCAQQKAQHGTHISTLDRRLVRLVDIWPMLSEEIRDRILQLAEDYDTTTLTTSTMSPRDMNIGRSNSIVSRTNPVE